MNPNFKIIDQSVDRVFHFTTDIIEQLAQCQYMTRISYRVEDTETATAPAKFVQNLINSKHYEPLEFVSIYADLEKDTTTNIDLSSLKKFLDEKAADPQNAHVRKYFPITVFTLRELVEWYDSFNLNTCDTFNIWHDGNSTHGYPYWQEVCKRIVGNKYMSELFKKKPELVNYLVRVKWVVTTNRQIGTEITRHRSLSKNWESTRHCDYSKKSKFDSIQICDPELYSQCIKGQLTPENADIINDIKYIADAYMRISASGNKVQAAYILPSCTAVKIAFASFWDNVNVVALKRTSNYCGKPHDDAKVLMTEVANELHAHTFAGVYLGETSSNDRSAGTCNTTQKVPNEACERLFRIIPNIPEDVRRRIIEEFGDDAKPNDDNVQKQSNEKEEVKTQEDNIDDFLRFLLALSCR